MLRGRYYLGKRTLGGNIAAQNILIVQNWGIQEQCFRNNVAGENILPFSEVLNYKTIHHKFLFFSAL